MKFLRDADNLAYLRRLTTVGYVLVGYVAMVFLCLLQHDAAMMTRQFECLFVDQQQAVALEHKREVRRRLSCILLFVGLKLRRP